MDTPTTQAQPDPASPPRLLRSRDDRVIAGVFGGLGRHLGVDPVILRIAGVALAFVGGLSVIAYIAALAFVPSEPEGGAPATPPANRAGPLAVAALVLLLVVAWPIALGTGIFVVAVGLPLLVVAAAGLAVWWLVSGEPASREPADLARRAALGAGVLLLGAVAFTGGAWAAGTGDGDIAAGVVIAAGALLVVGAFTGGLRLLIVPALALALGVGFVAAAGIDLRGGIGEEEHRPALASEIRPDYELGMGQLVVDLRDTALPDGDTPIRLRVGIGEALLLVPSNVCVSSTAEVGMGEVSVLGRDSAGVDVSFEDRRDATPGVKRIVVAAEVGAGAFAVRHARRNEFLLPDPPAAPGLFRPDRREAVCGRA